MSGSVYPCQYCETNRWTKEEIPCPGCGRTRTKEEQAKSLEQAKQMVLDLKLERQPRKKWFFIKSELAEQITTFEAWQRS
jgi:hypothetical protein